MDIKSFFFPKTSLPLFYYTIEYIKFDDMK